MMYGAAGTGTSGTWTGIVEAGPVATWLEPEMDSGPIPKSGDFADPKGLAAMIKKIVIMAK